MSWEDLSRRGLTVRPWDGPLPKPGNRYSPFRASFSKTVTLLARELEHLNAKQIVVMLDVQERDLRLDGAPRANARPGHPAAAVSFESKHGPLRYATCEFTAWQDNLRAIALGLHALRAVDRYGVSSSGEQYRGWRAIPMSTDPAESVQTREQAREVLDGYGGDTRRALFETHPDQGGNVDEFRKVIKARELLSGE